mgnify:CR=1 FL=1
MKNKENLLSSCFRLDTRDGYGIVSSRIGMRREAIAITNEMDVFAYVKALPENLIVFLLMNVSF